ncbi:MAG: DUF4445 domain-containing protein [Ardenticatenaceae bacterium]|nr:DUF4445 domain-containing protein [Ardenticatenaceae bacterium]MCB9443079.1 DUF4445 domain-containing protein [Ardenticatenaceae bacterium]
MPSGRRGRIEAGQSLLDAARQLGVEIESICNGRLTCGKCKIQIEDGDFAKHGIFSSQNHVTPPGEKELELLDSMNSKGCRLSCSAFIQGDVLAFVPEESRAQKQIIRKSATERVIDINPAVRQVYVEVDKAFLGEHRGDWGRLQDALAKQFQLTDLSIDLTVLRELQANLRKKDWAVTVTIWQEKRVIDVQPGYIEGTYGLAVDIGSTTIAGYLCDLRTGKILATESMMNPQVTYGEDLMSRISYAMMHKDGLEKMHTAVIDALNRLAASAAREAGLRPRQIHEAVFVGNTTMVHILLGISPVELGGAPFALANRDAMDVSARELGLRFHPGANVHVLPSEAGHVGADNVGVLIAEEPYNQDEIVLTVDVGTNAEILLGNRTWMYSASSPTGPAFEGAQITYGMRAAPGAIERVRIDPVTKMSRFRVIGEERWSDEWPQHSEAAVAEQPTHLAAGICGSGIIEVIAEMYLAGILLPDGRFDPELEHELVQWNGRKGAYILARGDQASGGKPILVTQDDVRSIQLAKAALYAGAKLLMMRAGIDRVDRVVLAGAFGSYIDPKHAMILGLIPDCELPKVYAVGNAAGDGARIALLNREKRKEAQTVAHWVKYVETAVDPDFQNEFVGAIHLPHASDAFPHLAGLLPEVKEVVGENGRSRRRRIKS